MKKRTAMSKDRVIEILRFGIVGVIATAIHYAIYYLLLPVMNESGAYSIGFFLSWICNFVMSSLFTFRVPMTLPRLFKFAGSHACNYFVQIIALNFFLWLGVDARLAPIPVYAVSVPICYLLVRFALKK